MASVCPCWWLVCVTASFNCITLSYYISDTGGQCLSLLMTGLCNCITNYTPDFLYQNPIDALFSQINFWNKTLHVSDSSSVHHQEFFTENTAMVYVIQVCWQLASRIRTELQFRPDPVRKLSVSTVKNSWWWIEELSETCRILFQI